MARLYNWKLLNIMLICVQEMENLNGSQENLKKHLWENFQFQKSMDTYTFGFMRWLSINRFPSILLWMWEVSLKICNTEAILNTIFNVTFKIFLKMEQIYFILNMFILISPLLFLVFSSIGKLSGWEVMILIFLHFSNTKKKIWEILNNVYSKN